MSRGGSQHGLAFLEFYTIMRWRVSWECGTLKRVLVFSFPSNPIPPRMYFQNLASSFLSRVFVIRLWLVALCLLGMTVRGSAQGVVINYRDIWRYQTPSADPTTAWRSLGFDDSAWSTGHGLLGFETAALPFPRLQRTIGAPGDDAMVYLFRKKFTYDGPLAGAKFSLDQIVDDGVSYYLNGTLLGSVRHAPGVWNNTASGSVADAVEELNVLSGNATALVSGENVLTAEVHQILPQGSDLVFGARLKINTPTQSGAAWRLENFNIATNTGIAADLQDPDNDLYPNLLEYALVLNPNHPNGHWAEIFTEAGNFTIRYLRRKEAWLHESVFSVQATTEPGGVWSSEGIVEQILSDDGYTQLVKVSAPQNSGKKFFKLKVQRAVTPEEYGALGDGVTNDTAAIQAAFNSGSPVLFPNKTYRASSLNVPANLHVSSPAGGILKGNTGMAKILNVSGTSNVLIEGLTIHGGGQTTDIYTGLPAVIAIYVTNATNVVIRNLSITKCGVVNALDPMDDNPYGGYGVIVESRGGLAENILIENITVTDIAGGGLIYGDGIYIAGYNDSPAVRTNNVTVRNCLVQRAGRHCYTVAGGEFNSSTPRDIHFENCVGDDAALSGLDIEDGAEVTISECTFRRSGVYTGYYNPELVYGSNYRLRAGVATSNSESHDITIQSCLIEDSYYGVTYGVGERVSVLDTTVRRSVISDITQGLANAPQYLTIDGCTFESDKFAMGFYRVNPEAPDSFLNVSNTTFNGELLVSSIEGARFDYCTMNRGIRLVAGSASIQNVTFDHCQIEASTAHGVSSSGIGFAVGNLTFDYCTFHGNSTFDGINVPYNGGLNWIVDHCVFNTLANGIHCSNSNEQTVFDRISDNTFTSVTNGVDIHQAITNGIVRDNTFSSVSGWCISFTDIFTPTKMQNYQVTGNSSTTGVTNGLRLQIINGSYEFVNITNNNFSTSSGTNCLFDSVANSTNCIRNNVGTPDFATGGCN